MPPSSLSLSDARRLVEQLKAEIRRGVVGQEGLVDRLVDAIVADGHVLVEGVPGLGKTRAVHLLARACGGGFKRLQFTPDLLPADIIGTQVYNRSTGGFETQRGPIFAPFILADEINRAAPKVQSALLEAMQERQVTIGPETHRLPRPFFVFATQNPVEQEGTYPLPEAQVDRFLLKIVVTYPSPQDEERIVRLVMDETELPEVEARFEPETILRLQAAARTVFVEERIVRYAVDLVSATRQPNRNGLQLEGMIELGASPRASLALVQVARARALADGRDAVLPEDVKEIAPAVLRHRILPTYHAEAEGVGAEEIVGAVLGSVEVP